MSSPDPFSADGTRKRSRGTLIFIGVFLATLIGLYVFTFSTSSEPPSPALPSAPDSLSNESSSGGFVADEEVASLLVPDRLEPANSSVSSETTSRIERSGPPDETLSRPPRTVSDLPKLTDDLDPSTIERVIDKPAPEKDFGSKEGFRSSETASALSRPGLALPFIPVELSTKDTLFSVPDNGLDADLVSLDESYLAFAFGRVLTSPVDEPLRLRSQLLSRYPAQTSRSGDSLTERRDNTPPANRPPADTQTQAGLPLEPDALLARSNSGATKVANTIQRPFWAPPDINPFVVAYQRTPVPVEMPLRRGETTGVALTPGVWDMCRVLAHRVVSKVADICPAASTFSLGTTRAGLTILGRLIADSNAHGPRVLVIAGIDGRAQSSTDMALHWISALRDMPQADWLIIPAANPEGLSSRPHRSANIQGVDIDRNFPTRGWKQTAGLRLPVSLSESNANPGSSAASEPETKAITKSIAAFHPDLVVAITSGDGLATLHSQHARLGDFTPLLPAYEAYRPGSLAQYAFSEHQIDVLELSMPIRERSPDAAVRKRMLGNLEVFVARYYGATTASR